MHLPRLHKAAEVRRQRNKDTDGCFAVLTPRRGWLVAIYPLYRRCDQHGCRGKHLPAVIGRKMGSFCAQHALDGTVDVTTITTATTNNTTSRSSFAEVGGSTRELDGLGEMAESQSHASRRSREELRRTGAAERSLPKASSPKTAASGFGRLGTRRRWEGTVHRVEQDAAEARR